VFICVLFRVTLVIRQQIVRAPYRPLRLAWGRGIIILPKAQPIAAKAKTWTMHVDLCLNPKQFRPAEVRQRIPALRELLCRHQAQTAYLFGSAWHGSADPLSDLDIAVLPPSGLADWFDYYDRLYTDLCQLFRADNIDIVLLNQAPLSLQVEAIRGGECLLGEDNAAQFEEAVLARYADLAGWRQQNWEFTSQLARRGLTTEVRMVNKERVERFVFLIRDGVQDLRALNLAEMSLEVFLQDNVTQALAEHYLRRTIEATLDLGRHVIVKTGLGVPQEYREIGKILRQKAIVPADLGHRLEAMAGMRNVLVHLYWDIDYPLIYRTIREDLDVFEAYVAHLFKYLDSLEKPSE
jgi:uncharacterized protein YutE (UPF0331/DUF86 family)/predicted nucleotidyltransferase